ncbi:MAG: F0F1 ATP synthase subunit A [Bacteroides sp.]
MNRLQYIIGCVLIFCFVGAGTLQAQDTVSPKIDVKEIVFGHIGDAYEWHVTTWGDTEFVVPLPIIVRSNETGWHFFLSSAFREGTSEGFYIAGEGKHKDKIVERKAATGEEVRPFDISITKTALSLMINSLLVLCVILGVAHWYKDKTPSSAAPKGFVGAMEMFITMIYDDVIKSCVGKDYKRYAPYLLTVFFFIFINNIMGLIPVFPGGANVTGNIAITLVLALCTFFAVNLFGSKEYWKEILWPDVPVWLKAPIPMMPVIELFGIFTKPFALMIRLFANIMAGHSVILGLTSLVFVTASMGSAINGSMTVVSVLFGIFMNCLELLVAFIQAYVFTMLSAVFIGLSRPEARKEKIEKTA